MIRGKGVGKMASKAYSSILLREKLAFGAGAFGKDFVYIFVSMYLLYFYTDVLGISAATAGSILLIVRFIDAAFDLPFGFMVDKTNSKWGKLRPYLLFGAVPYGVTAAFLFFAPEIGEGGKVFYAFSLYFLISILYSVVSIPHAALNTVMTDNPEERAQLTKYLMLFSGLAAALAGSITVPVVGMFPSERSGYFFMGAVTGVMAILLLFLCFKGTKEQVTTSELNENIPFKHAWKTVLTNKPFIILSASFLMMQISLGIRGAAGIYYFIYNVGNANLFSVVSAAGGLAGLVITFLLPAIVRRIGMKKFYIAAGLLTLLNFLSIYAAPVHIIPLVLILNIAASALTSVALFAAWGSLPDAIAYQLKKNGLHIEGVYYALYNFIQKVGSSIAGGLAGFVLAAFGYKSGMTPTARSLEGILVTSAIIPAVCALLFTIFMFFYRTKDKNKKESVEKGVING